MMKETPPRGLFCYNKGITIRKETMKIKEFLKTNYKAILAILATLLVGVGAGYAVDVAVRPTENKTQITVETDFRIELSEEQVPGVIELEEGEKQFVELPTVEEINSEQALAPEEELPDLGQGEYFDVSSPLSFSEATYGRCIDLDGYYGSQCVDLFAAFNLSYANRWPDVCGTGAARGLWDCRDKNAGEEYELITDPTALQAGDWVVFGGGAYGHVGMALGPYNDGYVALLGENQGGAPCAGGGAATNVINMSTKTFLGAFRPKTYIVPEPEPEPEPAPTIPVSGCVQWHLLGGDTLSKIMLECENTVVYGEAMDAYAKTWYSLVYVPGQSVYDGWYNSQNGVGLYAGDDIEHRTGN